MISVIRILPAAQLLLLIACSSHKEEHENVTKNSIQAEIAAPKTGPEVYFKKEIALPLIVDTAFLFHMRENDSLGSSEVKQLAASIYKHPVFEGREWEINEFCRIDSIKATGSYMKWSEGLDIGMTKYANAYAVGKTLLKDSVTLFFWGLTTQSYEACPFSSDWTLFFSIFKDGVLGQTFILGNYTSAGDPPSLMTSELKGAMHSDGIFTLNLKQVNEDLDEPDLEITLEHYEFSIRSGKIDLLSEKKDKPYFEKKPTVKE